MRAGLCRGLRVAVGCREGAGEGRWAVGGWEGVGMSVEDCGEPRCGSGLCRGLRVAVGCSGVLGRGLGLWVGEGGWGWVTGDVRGRAVRAGLGCCPALPWTALD